MRTATGACTPYSTAANAIIPIAVALVGCSALSTTADIILNTAAMMKPTAAEFKPGST